MRLRAWQCAMAMAGFILLNGAAAEVRAQSADELKQRIQEIERSTHEQIETLKRMIEQQETRRDQERRAQEDRERVLRALQEQVERQQVSLQNQEERVAKIFEGWENFFDLQAGAKQGSAQERSPLGKDIQGNVYAGDQFKIRLGGSFRLHVQHNDTPVGEFVSSALLPDTSVPGGGDRGGRQDFRAFAGRSRLNLAIQGPDTLGGKPQGFFEMDFNQQAAGAGEGNAVNNNPRLRHAIGRWSFADLLTKGDELLFTFGQTTSFADVSPDTVDFNTMLAGLGASLRRNPRVELLHKYPVTSNIKFLTSIGFERPFFDNQALGGSPDLGSGAMSGFPAVSGGIGLEAGRIGRDFGVGKTAIYVRTTWGEFEERFTKGAIPPAVTTSASPLNFDERHFTNQVAQGNFILDRIGFNKTGRALTLSLWGGGVWTRGEGRITNSEFDRRVVLDRDGSLTPAQSVGGWINPMFWITDTLSIRWAGGAQYALDDDRFVVTGSGIAGAAFPASFFRVNNRQSEISLWWTPGPFTFALSYNHTATNFRQVTFPTGSESRENENNKIEFISWFSF